MDDVSANRGKSPVLVIIAIILAAMGGFFLHSKITRSAGLPVESLRQSVFLVAVEYGIRQNNEVPFRRIGMGTCFLAGKNRLVSNRHVVAPWTSEESLTELMQAWNKAEENGNGDPVFFARHWVFQNGQPAYRKSQKLDSVTEAMALEDLFFPPTWRTDATNAVLRVAGVHRLFNNEDEVANDIGVFTLSGARLPPGARPLEFENCLPAALASVVAIGYPLTGQFEDQAACSAVSRGAIRRIQPGRAIEVGLACYQGNSGGPLFNEEGKVIGITSANMAMPGLIGAIQGADHQLTLVTPAFRVTQFLDRLASNTTSWDGLVYPGFEKNTRECLKLAWRGESAQAHSAFYWKSQARMDPAFMMGDALFRHVNGDNRGAIIRCGQALELAPEAHEARFLLLLFSFLDNRSGLKEIAAPLLKLDWRAEHSGEFYGYLARLLLKETPATPNYLSPSESRMERTLLNYVGGVVKRSDKQAAEASRLFLEAWNNANLTDMESLLVLRALSQMPVREAPDWKRLAVSRFQADSRLAEEVQRLALQMQERPDVIKRLLRMDPLNACGYHIVQTFAWSGQGEWIKAQSSCTDFLRQPHRAGSANYLGMMLLNCQLLTFTQPQQGRVQTQKFLQQLPADNWYAKIARCLLGQASLDVEAEADENHMLTLYTALGLKAEAEANSQNAIRFYTKALSTSKSDQLEYELSARRLKTLMRSE